MGIVDDAMAQDWRKTAEEDSSWYQRLSLNGLRSLVDLMMTQCKRNGKIVRFEGVNGPMTWLVAMILPTEAAAATKEGVRCDERVGLIT